MAAHVFLAPLRTFVPIGSDYQQHAPVTERVPRKAALRRGGGCPETAARPHTTSRPRNMSKADILVIDERDGRREATRRGIPTTGTLGVLDEAAERGLLDFSRAMTLLQQTNFRASPELVQSFLDRDAERQRRSQQP
jgi:hypothetical protein